MKQPKKPPAVQHQEVESSTIRSIGYDPDTQELHVAFNDTGMYVYQKVPVHLYDGLMMSGSKGKFFHSSIKGRFVHKRS
jgi:hypothetical protein